MRIISGQHRGLALATVGKGDPKAHLRPTADRVRESIFNVLAGGRMGDPIAGARVLDLFAGTGALGLEALSRGGAEVTFVDDGATAAGLIARNVALTRSADRTRLLRRDATRLPENDGEPFSLVFLDPPYGRKLGEKALASAVRGGWIAPGAVVVWEEGTAPVAPPGFVLVDRRRYGDTQVAFLIREAAA